ncbi:MAG TPA: 30S ribosomal protein S6 [Desulfobacteraceae bacterium]|nr:30S ribosomal protein S6 [Desulfobacteraceae bacterium]
MIVLNLSKDLEEVAKKQEEKTAVIDARVESYELVYIVKPELSDEQLEAKIETINQFITSHDGVIEDVQKWGKRKLAYPIKHAMEGNYVLIRFKIGTLTCKELETSLKISEDILRHLLIKTSK